jgi:signal transduction histidine kinase
VSTDSTDELSREELIRLLDAARAMARATGEPQFDKMVEGVLTVALGATRSDRAGLYMLDEVDPRTIVLIGRNPRPDADVRRKFLLDSTPMGEAFRDGHPRAYAIADIAEDAEMTEIAEVLRSAGVAHVACVPVPIQGSRGACLNFARTRDVPYDARDLRFAELLGEVLVVYVENARLYAEANRRLEETRMLLDVGRAVSASLELDSRLDAFAEVLARMVDASNTFVMLLDEQGQTLCGVATSNPAYRAEFLDVRIPMTASSIAVRAVKTRSAITIDDTTRSNEVRRVLIERYGEKSLLAIPILIQDRALGAIIIDDTRRPRVWTRTEIDRAELIAQNVSTGVANMRLYDEVRRRSVELELAQAELVKRERLAALGQLAAIMAHEVRNPLGVLFNSIGTLRKVLPPQGDAVTLLAIMSEEAQRLERLVRELLDFARPLAPSLEPESLKTVIEGAVDAASRELGSAAATLSVDVSADLPPVRCDASMIRRAIVNLVVNGAQAAGAEGRVVVRAGLESRGGRRFARVDVVDDGPGIADELATRIFEPFFTTKATGTGLGLAVVKSIVESHGGEIDHASGGCGRVAAKAAALARGTTMRMLLPVDRDGRSAAPAALPAGEW